MAVDENPSEVTDFPVLPSANPACASHICPLGIDQWDSDVRR